MKASELRIGNLLKAKKDYHNQFHGNGIVSSIEESKFVILDHYPGKWFEPIPLTEEWLLKFGFYINPNYVHPSFDEYILESGFGIGNFNDEFWLVDFLDQTIGSPKIKYVHQLQNLYFALTGEELTLNQES